MNTLYAWILLFLVLFGVWALLCLILRLLFGEAGCGCLCSLLPLGSSVTSGGGGGGKTRKSSSGRGGGRSRAARGSGSSMVGSAARGAGSLVGGTVRTAGSVASSVASGVGNAAGSVLTGVGSAAGAMSAGLGIGAAAVGSAGADIAGRAACSAKRTLRRTYDQVKEDATAAYRSARADWRERHQHPYGPAGDAWTWPVGDDMTASELADVLEQGGVPHQWHRDPETGQWRVRVPTGALRYAESVLYNAGWEATEPGAPTAWQQAPDVDVQEHPRDATAAEQQPAGRETYAGERVVEGQYRPAPDYPALPDTGGGNGGIPEPAATQEPVPADAPGEHNEREGA